MLNISPIFLLIWGDVVGQFLSTFKEFPPRQEPASFSIDQVMEKLQIGSGSK
jgi:arylsulfatase